MRRLRKLDSVEVTPYDRWMDIPIANEWLDTTDMAEEWQGITEEEEDLDDRQLDAIPRLKITFNNCLFENNGPGIKTESTHYGIIKAETGYVDVVVNNSIFLNNAFDGSRVVVRFLCLAHVRSRRYLLMRISPVTYVDRAIALRFR
jgi:hypothetical protein